jgi:cytochrome oxidase Cu insertion factor (SCO1/SenC/PrrC family)
MPRLIAWWLGACLLRPLRLRPLLAIACLLGLPAAGNAHDPTSLAATYQQQMAARAPAPRSIPDAAVVDQDGRPLSFYRDLVHGRTVAIDFIFTDCSTFCRPVTANLRAVQEQLGARIGKDIMLISISVDPANDTPERLKSYAAEFDAGPGWTFVTGSKPEVDRLLTAFGVGTHGPEDHSSLTLIGNDATGRWSWTDSLASPDAITAALVAASRPVAEAGGKETGGTGAGGERHDDSVAAATARFMPNVELVDQDGKTVHLYDDLMKDKVVLLDFIYTQCTDACSPLTQNLANVQALLGERVGGPISMVSITVDPADDTPPVLKAFAGKFGVRPGWAFLTGRADRLATVAHKLGGFTTDWQDHSTQIIIGNVPAGQWVKINGMAAPEVIARAVLRLAASGG